MSQNLSQGENLKNSLANLVPTSRATSNLLLHYINILIPALVSQANKLFQPVVNDLVSKKKVKF